MTNLTKTRFSKAFASICILFCITILFSMCIHGLHMTMLRKAITNNAAIIAQKKEAIAQTQKMFDEEVNGGVAGRKTGFGIVAHKLETQLSFQKEELTNLVSVIQTQDVQLEKELQFDRTHFSPVVAYKVLKPEVLDYIETLKVKFKTKK